VSFTTAIKETVATACKLAKQAIGIIWCCNIIGSKIASSGEVKDAASLNASQQMSSMGMCKHMCLCVCVCVFEYNKIADPPKEW
jgi:hypothetical protein